MNVMEMVVTGPYAHVMCHSRIQMAEPTDSKSHCWNISVCNCRTWNRLWMVGQWDRVTIDRAEPPLPYIKQNAASSRCRTGAIGIKEPFLFKVASFVPKLNLSGSYEKKEQVFSSKFCVSVRWSLLEEGDQLDLWDWEDNSRSSCSGRRHISRWSSAVSKAL